MDFLFSIDELVEATGGRAENIHAQGISSISIDSRTLGDGALYVAIKGDRFDGHEFVHQAVAQGASVALVGEDKASELAGLPLIIVSEPLSGLVDIAKAARTRSKAKIVAITGSAGKTTTKSMVAEILSRAGKTHASIKSYNNHWGVPLMLASLPQDAEFGVFEIGMNHSGEITPLVELVRPDVALVTNVGSAHVGNFDGFEGIARAKAEIFSGLKPEGLAIVNADHNFMAVFEEVQDRRRGGQMWTYGFGDNAGFEICDYEDTATGCVAKVKHRFGNKAFLQEIKLRVQGRHMMANAVGAMSIASFFDVKNETIYAALKAFRASAGRGEVGSFGRKDNPLTLMDESYNANPASMAAALEVFKGRKAPRGRKILVLGDMLELGERSAQMHIELVGKIHETGASRVFLIGAQMADLKQPLSAHLEVEWAEKVEEIASRIALSLDYGDTIMVKGSLGTALSRVVGAIRQRFDPPEKA